ncbi:MAG TPA: penicillin-binding transpeptidase domain-containing protein [Solirubrobacteraceae bacterium]|nr:penicillin-binding transpeptidase domain-containing protein [Solirubrobacteraceae bacterium]
MSAADTPQASQKSPRGKSARAPNRRRDSHPRGELARRRLLAGALLVVLVTAGVVLLIAGGNSSERALARRFVDAWQRGDYRAMYALVSDSTRQGVPLGSFRKTYRDAANTATLIRHGIVAGRPGRLSGHAITVDVRASTRIFGVVSGRVRLAFVGSDSHTRIAWSPEMAFPGLTQGQPLTRTTRLPPRAAILARDGTALASGPLRGSPLGASALPAVGMLGKPPAKRLRALRAAGYPAGARVGETGIEGALEARLAGRPGGELLAGQRVLASSRPQAAPPLRTTIDPRVQRAAVVAIGSRLGGVVALNPRNGQVLAVAGIGTSERQPPGSTFKMVTLTGVLEARLATPRTKFPVQTEAKIEGVSLQNANGESCGGTLAESFAQSCNSVFAPLGVKLGAKRLVEVAQRFGFNRAPGLPGAATSTVPPKIPDALAVGSSAIGQYQVDATALQMAVVAATIANAGQRPTPTFSLQGSPQLARATDPRTARTVRELMVGVVRHGTGTPAAIGGIVVAGKTGTAELTSTNPNSKNSTKPDPMNTDAWFAAFAPARKPRIAMAIVLVKAGAGKQTAAPAARSVLVAGLRARH